MHILLMISMFLVLLSTALLTLVTENKKIYQAICYYFLILFGQVVVTYESLSVFSAIKPLNVLIINFLILFIAFFIWNKSKNKPEYTEEIKNELIKAKFALNGDKWLNAVAVVFTVFLIINCVYCFVMPIFEGDAVSYHIARLPYWYQACNLNHFEIADARAIVMPINSEIFYMWAYSFIKSDIFVRFFSFFSAILFLFTMRAFLKELKVVMKLSLWAIFSVFSLYNVMFTVSSFETNLTVVTLISVSMYLFLVGVKTDKKIPLFFATLSYALAIGTKTPALQILPAFFVICCVISYCLKKKDFYKPLLLCSGFLVVNFLIFGAYNYILNFIEFGNPLSSPAVSEYHCFQGGIKGFVANIIRYLAMFINFSGVEIPYGVGVQFSEASWRIVTALSNIVIALLGIDPDLGVIISEKKWFAEGNSFENMIGLGILGFMLFIPSLVISLRKIKTSTRNLIIGVTAYGFFINMLILSCTLGYMLFSIRFIMIFVMLAFPIFIFMFIRKKSDFYKKVIAFIMIYSLTVGFLSFERKFFPFLGVKLFQSGSLQKFKEDIVCQNETFFYDTQCCSVVKMTKIPGKYVKVLYFPSWGTDVYYIGHVQDKNYSVDIKLLEKTEENTLDWDSYDYIVVPNVQNNSYLSYDAIDKYRNAVILQKEGSTDGKTIYEFKDDMFANCVYSSSRNLNINWLTADKDKFTRSKCYFKHDLFIKHGFKFFAKIEATEKVFDKDLSIYVNTKK